MITSAIKQIRESGKLEPDLMKSENGNNFRAISEAKIIEAISPILEKEEIFYTTEVKDFKLETREVYGKNGKKLIYCASLILKVNFFWNKKVGDCEPINTNFIAKHNEYFCGDSFHWPICSTEAVGMGIDDNDKAAGKAYTYALKYALLKFFRLKYGDDPDFKASEPIPLEKPKSEEQKERKSEEKARNSKTKNSSSEVQNLTEKQRDYIIGMMKSKGIQESIIIGKFGYEPSKDEFIPMPTARKIIKFLEEQEDLPF